MIELEKKEMEIMTQYRFQAVCQWCGATGTSITRNVDTLPTTQPCV